MELTREVIDLNADAGESFGPWPMGQDERLFPYLSSVNLACGFHGGDPLTIQRTVKLAKETGVQVGAHPGFPDLVGFGRRDMAARPEEVCADVLYQLGALEAFLGVVGLKMHHVKPHGALYLRMMRNMDTAEAVARAVRDYDSKLPLVVLGGPGGEIMQRAAERHGVKLVLEAFPDRAYLSDGRLAPRSLAGAVIHDPDEAAARALAMVVEGQVAALNGGIAKVEAQTLCIHGDNPEAPEIARAVRNALEGAGIRIEAF
jgi:5-oxoprolinase (ATP-hydrolysing) subunit A